MGNHRKPKTVQGRHVKPREQSPMIRRVAVGAAGTVAIPVAAFTFSSTASAATATQWNCIAGYETGDGSPSSARWHLESGDPEGAPGTGASAWGGGLQFQPASWGDAIAGLQSRGIDTSHFGVHASSSTKQQQILAAEELEGIQGPSAWATNGDSSCATLSPSMFVGGPNPWSDQGYSGNSIPASVIDGSSGDDFNGGSTPVTPAPDPDPTPAPVTHPTWGSHHGWHWKGGKWCRNDAPTPPVVPVPPVIPTDPAPPVAPAACDHIVVPGDTVSAVARANAAPLADVEAVNPSIAKHQADYGLIFAGGHIHLPAGFCDGNQ